MWSHFAALAIAATMLPAGACLPSGNDRRHLSAYGPCDAGAQRLALLTFFNNTNGAAWINATGWPSASVTQSPASLAQFAVSTPLLTTSSCMASDGTALPNHCCWYGVQCCTPTTCTTTASSATSAQQQSCSSSSAACSCTTGLVIGLSLGLNNVSDSSSETNSAIQPPPPALCCYSLAPAIHRSDHRSASPTSFCPLFQLSGPDPFRGSSTALSSSGTSVYSTSSALSCNLQLLQLNQNQLTGGIPSGLTAMTRLKDLSLAGNNLTGM